MPGLETLAIAAEFATPMIQHEEDEEEVEMMEEEDASHMQQPATVNGRPVKKGAWTKEEDALLIEKCQSNVGSVSWAEVAQCIEGRTAKQCRERWCFCLDPAITRSDWTEEEDEMLLDLQGKVGNRWALITRSFPGRTENSIKTRFKSLMRRKLREWTEEEDRNILSLVQTLGQNWEEITTHIPKRSRNAIKNRYKELRTSDGKPTSSAFGKYQSRRRPESTDSAGLASLSDTASMVSNATDTMAGAATAQPAGGSTPRSSWNSASTSAISSPAARPLSTAGMEATAALVETLNGAARLGAGGALPMRPQHFSLDSGLRSKFGAAASSRGGPMAIPYVGMQQPALMVACPASDSSKKRTSMEFEVSGNEAAEQLRWSVPAPVESNLALRAAISSSAKLSGTPAMLENKRRRSSVPDISGLQISGGSNIPTLHSPVGRSPNFFSNEAQQQFPTTQFAALPVLGRIGPAAQNTPSPNALRTKPSAPGIVGAAAMTPKPPPIPQRFNPRNLTPDLAASSLILNNNSSPASSCASPAPAAFTSALPLPPPRPSGGISGDSKVISYLGVAYSAPLNKYLASVFVRNPLPNQDPVTFVGFFNTALEAALARDAVELRLQGQGALLNFPS